MKKIINYLFVFFLIGVMCFCSYEIYKEIREYKKGTDIYKSVENTAIQNKENIQKKDNISEFFLGDTSEDKNKAIATANNYLSIDWEALKHLNPDIIGWIYCPGTDLNYPILKSVDNKDYLYKTVTGEKNSAGSIFLDHMNNPELLDYNSIIYGHNMKNGSMFRTINHYKSEDYYKEHPVIHIYTPKGKKEYNIIAAFKTSTSNKVYTYGITSKTSYEEWLKDVCSYSDYNINTKYDINKRTITLSTCDGSSGNGNRVVVLLQEKNEIIKTPNFAFPNLGKEDNL